MQRRGTGSMVRRSGFGNLPKSEKPDNKDSKTYCERREVRRSKGAERHRRYEEKKEHERYVFLRALMA